MQAYIAFGSDTDCDGTTYFAEGFWASSLADAWRQAGDNYWEVICCNRANLGMLTRRLGVDVGKLMHRRFVQDNSIYCDDGRIVARPFRYTSLGACWNPWVYDDSIGIPALDSRYDDDLPGLPSW